MIKQHKYLFGKRGTPLKLKRKIKEKRIFPNYRENVIDYINAYFELNHYFVRSEYGFISI